MRHLKSGKRLGVTTSHRKTLMRNLVTALLEHREIKTTLTRAKEMRKYCDKMVTLGKRQSLNARRQALAFIKSKAVVRKLFDEYASLYADRNGGYTRIFKLGQRRLGDGAQMALIQMVGLQDKEEEKDSTEAISEIKKELHTEEESSSLTEKTVEKEEQTSDNEKNITKETDKTEEP